MKQWVETIRVEIPNNTTMLGRFGVSIMDVAYSKWLDQWYWVQPGGILEKIAEPEALFLDEKLIHKIKLKSPRARREKPNLIRRKRADQLALDL